MILGVILFIELAVLVIPKWPARRDAMQRRAAVRESVWWRLAPEAATAATARDAGSRNDGELPAWLWMGSVVLGGALLAAGGAWWALRTIPPTDPSLASSPEPPAPETAAAPADRPARKPA